MSTDEKPTRKRPSQAGNVYASLRTSLRTHITRHSESEPLKSILNSWVDSPETHAVIKRFIKSKPVPSADPDEWKAFIGQIDKLAPKQQAKPSSASPKADPPRKPQGDGSTDDVVLRIERALADDLMIKAKRLRLDRKVLIEEILRQTLQSWDSDDALVKWWTAILK